MTVFTNPADGAPEHARAYVTAVLELVGDREPMEILRGTDAAIASATEGLSTAQMARPEASGKWSITQVLQHLADSELVWGWRLRLALTQDRPRLTGFDQDRWAERLSYAEVVPGHAKRMFAVLREAHLWLLDRTTEADRARVAVHAERGDESVTHMIRLYAGHDILHRRQIDRIRTAIT